MARLCPVLVVVATALLGSTVALAPCDDAIIAKLSAIPECYRGGKPPPLTAVGGQGTHVRISEGELPAGTKCVVATAHYGSADVTIFLTNGGKISYTMKQEPKDGTYLLETDSAGKTYRLYIIHNERNVYSYYRCIDGTTGGTGTPMGDVAVGCKNTKDAQSIAVIDRAMTCFAKLGINNVKPLDPCDC